MDNPVLSLCIPTNGVCEWVFPVLDSIYSQGCDETLFEVVVTDNGDNIQFKEEMVEYCKKHDNINYIENHVLPFLNEIEAYKNAQGMLIKYVNHRTVMLEGVLKRIIDFAIENKDTKPLIYFSNGVIKLIGERQEYSTFDEFVSAMTYWSSWSTGMTIWKTDFERLPIDLESYNELFPHTKVLFNEKLKERYIIDNTVIFNELPVNGIPKAHYDIFYAFAVEYLGIILSLKMEGFISTDTFLCVKNDTLNFIANLYFEYVIRKKKCSYDLSSLNKSIEVFYRMKELKKRVIKIIFIKARGHFLK